MDRVFSEIRRRKKRAIWMMILSLLPIVALQIQLSVNYKDMVNGSKDVITLTQYVQDYPDKKIEMLGEELTMTEYPMQLDDLMYWDHDKNPETDDRLERIYTIDLAGVGSIGSTLRNPIEDYYISDMGRIFYGKR